MENHVNNSKQSDGQEPKLKYEGTGTWSFQPHNDRIYRILDLDTSGSCVHVRLRLDWKGKPYHQDRFDLTRSCKRSEFANNATCSDPGTIKHDLMQLLEAIETRSSVVRVLNPEAPSLSENQQAMAEEFLKAPNLILRIESDLEQLGIVEETDLGLLAYFTGISRLLGGIEASRSMPMGLHIKGEPSTGKSAIMNIVRRLMPPESVEVLSSMSEKALVYAGKDLLKHKFIVLDERAGGQQSDYYIRILLSEGRIRHLVTIQDPKTGEFVTKEYETEGPTSWMTTTPMVWLNLENRSRILEVYTDPSIGRTAAVLKYQADARSRYTTANREWVRRTEELHQNAQRLLRPGVVEIPWARHIIMDATLGGPSLRRHQEKIYCLIEVAALLRQFQKETRMEEDVLVIPADIEDYRIIHRLVTRAIPDLHGDLDRRAATLIEEARRMTAGVGVPGKLFTRADLIGWTPFSNFVVRQLTDQLVEWDHLKIEEGGIGGKPYRYALGKPLPEIRTFLPTPKELEERIEKSRQPSSSASKVSSEEPSTKKTASREVNKKQSSQKNSDDSKSNGSQ